MLLPKTDRSSTSDADVISENEVVPTARSKANHLIDPFCRSITYLRISVTDRCDLRCLYCMAETMNFLPKKEVLSLEELDRLGSIFIGLGVRTLRLTGGEPLVRRNIGWLIERLARHLGHGLDEITLTTNGTHLAKMSKKLYALGVRRVNVSLDTLKSETFEKMTRWGRIERTLNGIDAALDAGLKIKINTVALRGINDHEINDLIQWCGQKGCDMALIETMPLGDIGANRLDHYMPLSLLRSRLEKHWNLIDIDWRSAGPARYCRIEETGQKLGFITPMTHNFCESCNRVRLGCDGKLYLCLGQEDWVDLRSPLRQHQNNDDHIRETIHQAIAAKPIGHDFVLSRTNPKPALRRHMNVTGG